MDKQIAVLDRGVHILSGGGSKWPTTRQMSELRTSPFLVLLGEPGIGKSTVLHSEAASEKATVLKVRQLMTGVKIEPGTSLFLDALDEYRIDGARFDKTYGLGKILQQAEAVRWRLTCRAEDWRSSADLEAIRGSTSGQEIVVAQLLPLTHDESTLVLKCLGELNPDSFLSKAHELGAGAFLESPLSLELLYKAVSEGANWPTSRHELFAAAIFRLAHERNAIHKSGDRSPVPKIIDAAEKACLVMLLSGRRALWRSHDEPPSDGDEREYLRHDELELENSLFSDMLDTTLFRGEGESFEPIHRTVAEYLAGRAIAKLVAGHNNAAAFPLGRAFAMVTGVDRKAPTELRGLYAWFAAHLAKLGHEDSALQLIEADAATVLAYGDAAVFSTCLRKAIFNNLDRDDPYFRAGDYEHDVAIGGFAAEDLATDFAIVLDQSSNGTHRLVTVFEALANGSPVESLRPQLWNITLDPTRPEWQRRRASDAWLNGAQHRVREIFDAVNATPASLNRELLRIHLAARLPESTLITGDIKSLIADFASTETTNTVGRLTRLADTLANTPRGELFDVHVNTWVPKDGLKTHSIELDHFFDVMLASAIRNTPQVTAEQVWRWANNVRESWGHLHEESGKALREWLDIDFSRECALFDLITANTDTDTPWISGNSFITLTGRYPSATLVRHLLQRAQDPALDDDGKSILAVAVENARREIDDPIYQETLTAISARPDCEGLMQRLISAVEEKHDQKMEQAKTSRHKKSLMQKAHNVEVLSARTDDLRIGKDSENLKWAAEQYFLRADSEEHVGVARITHLTNKTITEAILAGWRYVVTTDFNGINAKMLGEAVGKNEIYCLEWVALAGVNQLMTEGALPDIKTIPMVVAIAVLKASWMLRGTDERKQLENWAFKRLNAERSAGAEQLIQFWTSAIDSGATHIESFARVRENDTHGSAVADALYSLLDSRRSMPAVLLRSVLRMAVKLIDLKRLLTLSEIAIADNTVSGEQHQIWLFLAFSLDPYTHGPQLLSDYAADGGTGLYEEFRSHEMAPIETVTPTARTERESMIIRLVGPTQPPDDDERVWHRGTSSRADIVRRAIQILQNYTEVEAGKAIQVLIANPLLAEWKRNLRHAYAQWTRSHRERSFRYPTPEAIVDVLNCGAPVNAADLLALVMDELNRLRRELRTSDSTPWKHYWNRDSTGKVLEPLIENQCRDQLLERLRDRIARYKIAAALPEARRSEETRADMLILSAVGKPLSIEVKRHYNATLWEAPSTQLQGYTESEGSDGYGIYLVFWFGLDQRKLPGRKDSAALPLTGSQLETMLIEDLPTEDRERIQVIVFDVSKGAAGISTK